MKYLLPSLLLVSLVTGCSGSDPSDGAPDDEATTFQIAGEDDVRFGNAIVDLPYKIAYALPIEGPQTCPAVTPNDDGWVLEGGCTDADGFTYSGRVTITRAIVGESANDRFVFEQFEVKNAKQRIQANGTVTSTLKPSSCGFPGPNPLEADGLQLVVGGEAIDTHGGYWPGGTREVAFEYTSYRFGWDGNCKDAGLEAEGAVKVDGRGTLGFDSHLIDGDCPREADSGETHLRGANQATLFFRGKEACDSCVDYTIDGGASGAICYVL